MVSTNKAVKALCNRIGTVKDNDANGRGKTPGNLTAVRDRQDWRHSNSAPEVQEPGEDHGMGRYLCQVQAPAVGQAVHPVNYIRERLI